MLDVRALFRPLYSYRLEYAVQPKFLEAIFLVVRLGAHQEGITKNPKKSAWKELKKLFRYNAQFLEHF